MPTPQRYSSGVSVFPTPHILNNMPAVPTQVQVIRSDNFIPFRAGDFTATTGGTGATAAAFPWNSGVVKVTAGSTTPFTSYLALGANCIQFVPGNQNWFDSRIAAPTGSMVNPTNDSVIYMGYFDTTSPLTAANGLYFTKPAGGTSVNFVVLKGGVATTFSNIADLAKPSGIFGDATSLPGALTANVTGTTLSTVTLTTQGSGYRIAPLVIVTGTAGSGATAYVQLGGSTQGSGNAGGNQGIGAPLFAPYITAAGSGYTAGTIVLDEVPFINLQMYSTGKGNLMVGVNGQTVLNIGIGGQGLATPGQTYNVATGGFNSFAVNATLSAGVSPVAQAAGAFYHMAPQVPMQLDFGLTGSTGTNRAMYVESVSLATELN